MTAPPRFQMVETVLGLEKNADVALHATVYSANLIEPDSTSKYEGQTKQFLLVRDGRDKQIAVSWSNPDYDLQPGDEVQIYSGARDDRATAKLGKPASGKPIIYCRTKALLVVKTAAGGPPPPAEAATAPAANGTASNGPKPAPAPAAPPSRKPTVDEFFEVFGRGWEWAEELVLGHPREEGEALEAHEVEAIEKTAVHFGIGFVDGKIDLGFEATTSTTGSDPEKAQADDYVPPGGGGSDDPRGDYIPPAGSREDGAPAHDDDDIPF